MNIQTATVKACNPSAKPTFPPISFSESCVSNESVVVSDDTPPTYVNASKILQKRWVCDICKVKWFLDFQEACLHEEKCCGDEAIAFHTKRDKMNIDNSNPKNSALHSTDTEEVQTIDLENLPAEIIDVSDEDNHSIRHKKFKFHNTIEKSISSTVNVDVPAFNITGDSSIRRKSQRLRNLSSNPASCFNEGCCDLLLIPKAKRPNNSTGSKPTKLASLFRQKPAHRKNTDHSLEENFMNPCGKRKGHIAPQISSVQRKRAHNVGKVSKKKLSKKTKGASSYEEKDTLYDSEMEVVETKDTVSLMHGKRNLSDEVIAEHHAARFFAKRKKAAIEERERQRKRDDLRRSRVNDNKSQGECDVVVTSNTLTSANQALDERNTSSSMSISVPKFPCPSHIVPNPDTELTETEAASLQSYHEIKVPKFRTKSYDVPAILEHDQSVSLSFLTESDGFNSLDNISTQGLFSSIFESRNAKIDVPENNKLWADKYTITKIPQDILGKKNKTAAMKLLEFIEEWKVRRHTSLRAKAKKSKNKLNRKTKAYCGYDSDDWFIDDSDLNSIFIITGKTGSGKSSLVHAVAEQSSCVVMEINSSEPRGGQALKKRLQECTLSHSSVALMRRRENSIFVDDLKASRNDDSCKSVCSEESDFEDGPESSSLSLVFIDEVDLLFEDDGDSGFWLALLQLSQKAKSPIILTASSLPQVLSDTSAIRFEQIELQRPSIEECCTKIIEVSNLEGMVLRKSDNSYAETNALPAIVELFDCDLRKILNEMQLYRFHMLCQSCHPNNGIVSRASILTSAEYIWDNDNDVDRPVILNIDPVTVPSDTYTVIHIVGKHFTQTEVAKLYLGGKLCNNYSVVSDSKIVAICPPLVHPDGFLNGLRYTDSFMQSDYFSRKFVEVVVRKKCSNGAVLDSKGCIPPFRSNWNIEYNTEIEQKMPIIKFIGNSTALKGGHLYQSDNGLMSSDEEFEKPSPRPKLQCLEEPSLSGSIIETLQMQNTPEVISSNTSQHAHDADPVSLLIEAISAERQIQPVEKCPLLTPFSHSSPSDAVLINLMEDTSRLSDAAFLEYSLSSIPTLAGPVEGFGANIKNQIGFDTAEIEPSTERLCKERNNKPPSFEYIYLSGANENRFFYGCSDAYMTYPNRQRDRKLISANFLYSRSNGSLDNYIKDETLEKDSEDNVASEEFYSFQSCFHSRIRSEDDILLGSLSSTPILLLPSMLLKGLEHATEYDYSSNAEYLLQLRKHESSTKALKLACHLLANGGDWSKICFGLRWSEHFTKDMAQKNRVFNYCSLMNNELALDYFPYLRIIAQYENNACAAARQIMDTKRESSNTSRRSQRSRRDIRSHYLEVFCKDESVLIELSDF